MIAFCPQKCGIFRTPSIRTSSPRGGALDGQQLLVVEVSGWKGRRSSPKASCSSARWGRGKRKKRKKKLPKSGRRLPPHSARCLLPRIHVHVEATENLDIFSSGPLFLAATSSVFRCQLLEAFGRTSHISYVSMDPDLFSVCVSPEEHKMWHCPGNDFRKHFPYSGLLVLSVNT